MRILQWRPRQSPKSCRPALTTVDFKFPAIGEFAGRARYVPGDVEDLPATLRAAVGKVVEVQFVGMAPSGAPFVGQSLYRECAGGNALGGIVVPEQDLDFIP